MIFYRINADSTSERVTTGFDTLDLDRDFEGRYRTYDSISAPTPSVSYRLWVNDDGVLDGEPRNTIVSALYAALTNAPQEVYLYGDVFVTAHEDEDGEIRTLDELHDEFIGGGLAVISALSGTAVTNEVVR